MRANPLGLVWSGNETDGQAPKIRFRTNRGARGGVGEETKLAFDSGPRSLCQAWSGIGSSKGLRAAATTEARSVPSPLATKEEYQNEEDC